MERCIELCVKPAITIPRHYMTANTKDKVSPMKRHIPKQKADISSPN